MAMTSPTSVATNFFQTQRRHVVSQNGISMLPKKKKTDLKRKKDKKGEVKSVSFYPDCTVMNTLHLNDYTDQEMRDCWYSYTELKHIRKEARTTVRYLLSGGDDKSVASSSSLTSSSSSSLCNESQEEEHCARGLEYCSPQLRELRIQVKIVAREAVLDEQEYQSLVGVVDPERLSKVYKDQTAESKHAAALLGKSDEYVARQLYFHQLHPQQCTHHHHPRRLQKLRRRNIPRRVY